MSPKQATGLLLHDPLAWHACKAKFHIYRLWVTDDIFSLPFGRIDVSIISLGKYTSILSRQKSDSDLVPIAIAVLKVEEATATIQILHLYYMFRHLE
jgi:hypothetical protein